MPPQMERKIKCIVPTCAPTCKMRPQGLAVKTLHKKMVVSFWSLCFDVSYCTKFPSPLNSFLMYSRAPILSIVS